MTLCQIYRTFTAETDIVNVIYIKSKYFCMHQSFYTVKLISKLRLTCSSYFYKTILTFLNYLNFSHKNVRGYFTFRRQNKT